MTAKTKVVVAMSGGVDSSLTAALLLQQGYDVIGVTMNLSEESRDYDENSDRGCCSLSAVDDAKSVADKLGIPHYVMNFKEMFQEKVVDYFIKEYGEARTPNPCIACNRYIKFEGLLDRALKLGAEYVTTDHYAKIIKDSETGRYLLKKGADANKDQSYVLYHLNQNTLKHFMFPLGDLNKTETRKMAAELGLSVANKPESQEICFVPNDDYKTFLAEKAPAMLTPGNIINTAGEILGKHKGLALYTIGQRKGLGIAAKQPLYVLKLDQTNNSVVVGFEDEIFSQELIATDLNFLLFDKLTVAMEVKAKVRYAAKEAPAFIVPLDGDKVRVIFKDKQRAITPGQAVVFYQDDIVIGGGTIID